MKQLSRLQNRKASVTAFVAIVLASVCLLNCVLLDLSRVLSFRRYAQSRVHLACDSILASFDSLLAAKYGLYGVNRVGAGDVEETFGTYIGAWGGSGFLDFKEFPLIRKDARLVAPLSERQILRSQIVDQMRIRTPVRGGKWLLEQLGVIEGSEELGRSTLYVAQGDELLQQADGKLRRLKELIEGMFQGDTACVNGYVKALWLYIELEPAILSVATLSGKDQNFVDQIITEHRQLRVLLTTYYDLHRESIVLIRELRLIADEIRSLIEEAQRCSEATKEGTALYEMIQALNGKVSTISNTANLSRLEQNANLLFEKIQGLDANLKALENPSVLLVDADSLKYFLDRIGYALSTNDIWDRFAVFTIRESSDLGTSEVPPVEGSLDTKAQDDFEIPAKLYHTLPSVEAKLQQKSNSFLIDFSGLDALWAMFKGGSFHMDISSVMTLAYEEFLINDYVLCYFGNAVHPRSGAYFQSEMEYILGGHASIEDNLKVVKERLLFLRFVLNLSHILTDREKCTLAEEMGCAIATAISGGVGGSFYAVLVMCAWSATESYKDVALLQEGKCIPILKQQADWHTSIDGLVSKENRQPDDKKGLSYTEYLLLLLSLESTTTKLYRIADMIEMNMTHQTGLRYRLGAVYTGVQGSAAYRPSYIALDLLHVFKDEDDEIYIEGAQHYGT